MAEIPNRDQLGCENRLVEERFLVLAQTQIQKLLNEKKLRYRDLSKRMGVSEARVSQMFGDEASNLTIRTIARVYHQLGETPVILSRRELDTLLGRRPPSEPASDPTSGWGVLVAEPQTFAVAQGHVRNDAENLSAFRAPRHQDWVEAEPAMLRRA
jgi:DNA-binding Xre family transcriptional regulator